MAGHDIDDLLSRLTEIEELLRFPSVEGHTNRAQKLALFIARRAPSGTASNLAMQVMSETAALRRGALPLTPDATKVQTLLQKLRSALQDSKSEDRR